MNFQVRSSCARCSLPARREMCSHRSARDRTVQCEFGVHTLMHMLRVTALRPAAACCLAGVCVTTPSGHQKRHASWYARGWREAFTSRWQAGEATRLTKCAPKYILGTERAATSAAGRSRAASIPRPARQIGGTDGRRASAPMSSSTQTKTTQTKR